MEVTIPYEEWKQAGIVHANAQLQSATSQQQPLSLLPKQQTSFTPAFDTNSQQLAQPGQFVAAPVVPPATLQSPNTPEVKKPCTTI